MEKLKSLLLLLAFLGTALGQERRTGNVCNKDPDCPDNAFCKSGTYCVCKDGYIIHPFNDTHRECLTEAQSIGDTCREDIQCRSKLGIHAECANGGCTCEPNSHFEGGRCYTTSLIGQSCSGNQNCYIGDKNNTEWQAFCHRGFCVCTFLHTPRDGGTRCVPDVNLGEKCEDQLQCSGSGQECSDGVCHCRSTNWTVHPIENKCVQFAKKLGDECETDVQCNRLSGNGIGAVSCNGGLCACVLGARRAKDLCWVTHLPGQDCNVDEECVSEEGTDGYCRSGRCTCDTCVPDSRDFASAAYSHTIVPATLFTVLLTITL